MIILEAHMHTVRENKTGTEEMWHDGLWATQLTTQGFEPGDCDTTVWHILFPQIGNLSRLWHINFYLFFHSGPIHKSSWKLQELSLEPASLHLFEGFLLLFAGQTNLSPNASAGPWASTAPWASLSDLVVNWNEIISQVQPKVAKQCGQATCNILTLWQQQEKHARPRSYHGQRGERTNTGCFLTGCRITVSSVDLGSNLNCLMLKRITIQSESMGSVSPSVLVLPSLGE